MNDYPYVPLVTPEQKPRPSRLNIQNISKTLVYVATSPQGPMGGLMPFLALNLVSKKKDPGLYWFVFSLASGTGTVLAYVIVKARSMVLTPYVIGELENIYKKLRRPTSLAAEEKISRTKQVLDLLVVIVDLLIATNMSLVFAGFNDIACDILSKKLIGTNLSFAKGLASVVGSKPFKTVFALASLIMNIPIFNSMQEFLRFKTIETARPAWRYLTEKPAITAKRQALLSILAYVKQVNIKLINSKLSAEEFPVISASETILESKTIQSAIRALKNKSFTDLTLQNFIQTLSTLTIPDDMQSELTPLLKHRVYALFFWIIAVIGAWGFAFSQQQATQGFISLFVDEDQAEASSHIILDNFGTYLMVLSMSVFYFHVVAISSLIYFDSYRQITLTQNLPDQGSYSRYWLPKVWFISLSTALVGVAATLSALEDDGIAWQSGLGIFLLITSAIGLSLFEIFGIHRFYVDKALSQLKIDKGENFVAAEQLIQQLDHCRAEIDTLTGPEISQLDSRDLVPVTLKPQKSTHILQSLRKLCICCSSCKTQDTRSPHEVDFVNLN